MSSEGKLADSAAEDKPSEPSILKNETLAIPSLEHAGGPKSIPKPDEVLETHAETVPPKPTKLSPLLASCCCCCAGACWHGCWLVLVLLLQVMLLQVVLLVWWCAGVVVLMLLLLACAMHGVAATCGVHHQPPCAAKHQTAQHAAKQPMALSSICGRGCAHLVLVAVVMCCAWVGAVVSWVLA